MVMVVMSGELATAREYDICSAHVMVMLECLCWTDSHQPCDTITLSPFFDTTFWTIARTCFFWAGKANRCWSDEEACQLFFLQIREVYRRTTSKPTCPLRWSWRIDFGTWCASAARRTVIRDFTIAPSLCAVAPPFTTASQALRRASSSQLLYSTGRAKDAF